MTGNTARRNHSGQCGQALRGRIIPTGPGFCCGTPLIVMTGPETATVPRPIPGTTPETTAPSRPDGPDVAGGISDSVNHNDKVFLNNIPWLALPWSGWKEGHGKVASP